ncbi:MAG TPA: WYL domain-containing protein [Thermosulfurimonas dismutans]|uniref:WYL domain-containing protein n=1 Tax=Thermosulfurimonas dismutans TaxID=999894 RepID=A0A7C3CSN4_9BACT|nr:WYL domain-containing protein [Thermosulfurimonas dismutans]
MRVPEVAQELEVSERTVYRYLNSLMEAGFPIYYDKERGTYAFTSNFSLRRALLETEEALVLALARKFLEPLLGKAAVRTLDQIEKKIAASPYISFSHFAEVFGVQGLCDPPHLLDLLKNLSSAIREHRVVKIEYEREPGETPEEREIEPYFVFFTGEFWYVHAWCRTKEGQRTFALDKIRTWQLTDRYFVPRKEVPSVEEIQEAFGPYVDETPREVIVHFAPEVKQYFLRRKWVRNQECRELPDGSLEVRFRVRGLTGFKHWLYRWLPWFRILSPESLAREVEEDLRSYLATCKNI